MSNKLNTLVYAGGGILTGSTMGMLATPYLSISIWQCLMIMAGSLLLLIGLIWEYEPKEFMCLRCGMVWQKTVLRFTNSGVQCIRCQRFSTKAV